MQATKNLAYVGRAVVVINFLQSNDKDFEATSERSEHG